MKSRVHYNYYFIYLFVYYIIHDSLLKFYKKISLLKLIEQVILKDINAAIIITHGKSLLLVIFQAFVYPQDGIFVP